MICYIGFYEQGANLRLRFVIDEAFGVSAQYFRLNILDSSERTSIGEIIPYRGRREAVDELRHFAGDILAMTQDVFPAALQFPLLTEWRRRVGSL